MGFSSKMYDCNILCKYHLMKLEQSVPKRRHIKCRRRGVAQKKEYKTDFASRITAVQLTCVWIRFSAFLPKENFVVSALLIRRLKSCSNLKSTGPCIILIVQ